MPTDKRKRFRTRTRALWTDGRTARPWRLECFHDFLRQIDTFRHLNLRTVRLENCPIRIVHADQAARARPRRHFSPIAWAACMRAVTSGWSGLRGWEEREIDAEPLGLVT